MIQILIATLLQNVVNSIVDLTLIAKYKKVYVQIIYTIAFVSVYMFW